MTDIPMFPRIEATIGADGSGIVVVDGVSHPVLGSDEQRVREEALGLVASTATDLGRPVRLTLREPLGERLIAVHPDGRVEPIEQGDSPIPAAIRPRAALIGLPPSAVVTRGDSAAQGDPAAQEDPADQKDQPAQEIQTGQNDRAVPRGPAGRPAPSAVTRRERRASFLIEDIRPVPATKGWRGLLARAGIKVAASAEELAERADVRSISQHWPGPRTIAVVNGKGGANKTPTTAMLAALFARNGGAGVLAWDNNETRGTLGWRTEQGPHDAVVQTLLLNTDRLLSPGAQSSDLAKFVHHQTGDKYDVLRSNPTMLAAQQRLTASDFDALHSVAAKYFRLIFIDSGNDESAERWLRMIDHTDQLVIATTALGEHAEAGALLLEALAQRDERSATLARNAVVIVSQSEKSGTFSSAQTIADGFTPLSRRAVSIPFDMAMHGGKLRYESLGSVTQRAWLAAAAAVAEGL